ncbi:6-hydroxypseudooxynicotine dehydrogenase complex subunit alpha [Methylobacterium crusticola]|uniref:6-hydroxypseudooxynicotine dehydrogenase complex subunit alpha n=1 Tax=Methylobacterium crusticola TaxID=1697972 RepID=A0ABQ4QV73_9HYPH|nr:FAD binding domain-containing protein [Methylobacterium crusticola]GJD48670.1 6-hydroxypseudooxynicotine dehydrogenase complex subunit alpha [Methylobacterium crusticola]
MKPAPFSYHAPTTRADLLALLAAHDDCRLLAGGQSLVPLLNLRLAGPAHLIDITRVAGLDGIARDGEVLRIGATTRQRRAERSPLVRAAFPLLSDALAHVGHVATRNRGTIGGSLAHMDPTAELSVVALVADATLTIESARGARTIPFVALPTGPLATAIAPDEVLTRIDLPLWPEGHGWGFAEVTRRGEGFAVVSAAALVALAPDGTCARAALAVGGLVAAPARVGEAEALLARRVPRDDRIAAAGEAAARLPAESDLYGPEAYKRHLARVLTVRALRQAVDRARGGVRD